MFPQETVYNIIFVEANDKNAFQKLISSNKLDLTDNIRETDIEHVNQIIKIKNNSSRYFQ